MSQPATEDRVSSGMNDSPPEFEVPNTKPDAESSAQMRELIDLLATAVVRVLGGEIYSALDHGRPVTQDPEPFAPPQRGGGWGGFAESFLRMNAYAPYVALLSEGTEPIP